MLPASPGFWVPYIVFYSILGSSAFPSIGVSGFALYHFVSLLVSISFAKYIYLFLLKNKYFLFFVLYIFLFAIIEVLYVDTDSMIRVLIRFINFIISFSIMVLIANCFIGRKRELDIFVRHFVVVVTLFGIYQLIARTFDLPFGILEHNRFRVFDNISQATSFFREPRYYGMFVSVFLYLILFYYKGLHRVTLTLLLILSGFLTQSLTAYFMLTSVLLLYLFRSFSMLNMAKYLLIASILVVIFLQNENVSNRIDLILNTDLAEVFQYLLYEDIGQDANRSGNLYGGACAVNAGCITIFGELGYLLQVLGQSPLFGYGIGYSFGDIYRIMALNGIVEISLRWGLLGLIMLFVFILRRRKNKARLFAITLVYMVSFGNIGQPLFWLLLSLIYIAHLGSLAYEKNIRKSNE